MPLLYDFTVFSSEKYNDSLCGISDHSRRNKSDTPEKFSNSQKIETHRKVTDLENIDFGPHIHHFCKGIMLYRTILEIFIRKNQNLGNSDYCHIYGILMHFDVYLRWYIFH